MTTFTSEDRQAAEAEPVPFAGWIQHSDDTVTRVIPKSKPEQKIEDPWQTFFERVIFAITIFVLILFCVTIRIAASW